MTRIDIMMKRIFAHFALEEREKERKEAGCHVPRQKLSDDVRFNLCEYYMEQGVRTGGQGETLGLP